MRRRRVEIGRGEIDGISGTDATLRAGALYLCMT